jgi:hypothetical protein
MFHDSEQHLRHMNDGERFTIEGSTTGQLDMATDSRATGGEEAEKASAFPSAQCARWPIWGERAIMKGCPMRTGTWRQSPLATLPPR